jgi:preprotein translocase subunit SecE
MKVFNAKRPSYNQPTDTASVVIMAIIIIALAFFFLDALWSYGGYPV